MYLTALESDVSDVQGGTTKEGIHLGVMAGTLDLIQSGYLGCEIRDGTLRFDPMPPQQLDGLHFPMRFRDVPLEVTLDGGRLTVAVQDDGPDRYVEVGVGDEVRRIGSGQSHAFDL